jgi:asparagine synthase (glutamine-hydrolysing)
MCGIAGIIQLDNRQYSLVHLKKMTDAITHRGPDGEGAWQNNSGQVLLGNRRLAIIDLSEAGNQPIHYQERFSVIHNGEIYNYIEIRQELKQKGFEFKTETDTEVVAAAYAHWGTDCLKHFDGMFAFVIWDEKEQEVFAARDRFGEKPFFFYYDQQEKTILFASEMKAIWAAGIARRPNLKMLFNYITIGYTDNPEKKEETFDSGINKLPAAHFLRLSMPEWSVHIENYWDIDPSFQQKKITDEEAIEKFYSLFSSSVKKRLRSDVEIGTSLSGGLDSSSVLSMVNELNLLRYKPQAFTASFPGFEKDELKYAKEVAQSFNLQHHVIDVKGEDLISNWEKLCYHQEEPVGSASSFAQFQVYSLAQKHGVKVLLDGQGADETLAGYHKYYKWLWQELYRKMNLAKSKELVAAKELGINEPFTYRNKIAAWFPAYASIVLERRYLLKAIRQEDLDKEFIIHHSKEAYYAPPDLFTLNGVLHFNTFTHGLEELLRYADRNSMAHGCEVRLPFLSHELVSFIFSLPAQFKIRQGWTKWILRQSMKNKLPGSIVWRKDKTGFEPPQKTWMENKIFQDYILEAKKKLVDHKILKPEALNKPVKALNAHEADNYDWRYLSAASIV